MGRAVRIQVRLLVHRASHYLRGLPVWLKASSLLLLIVAVAGLTIYIRHQRLYTVSDTSRQLLTASSVDTSQIKVTDTEIVYSEVEQRPELHGSVTVASPLDASADSSYRATISKDFKKGMTFGDSKGDLSFKLLPLFEAGQPEYTAGQVFFPVSATTKVFQTFKKNGVKEDIVLTESPGDSAEWQWKLELGDKLEARLLDDGSVGIFSASPYLFGNIDASDEASKELLEKARQGDKNHQVFAIPAPYVLSSDGRIVASDVSFSLDGDTLTLRAQNLSSYEYPISIDPSAVVTTTANFRQGSDDGMIDYSSADQIIRSDISLGTVTGGYGTQSSLFTSARYHHSSVVYNGYLYIIGGTSDGSSTFFNDVHYCSIGVNGLIGACTQQANAFIGVRGAHSSVVYNGYLYIIGGNGGGAFDDIQYCKINANGSLGGGGSGVNQCTRQTGALSAPRTAHSSAVYNGYLYIIGGVISSTFQNDIEYCKLNADGSVGTGVSAVVQCTSTSSFTGARYLHASTAHNGYLYITGGLDSFAYQNDIHHCPINSDGTVGTCVQQYGAFTTGRNAHTTVIYNGYLYIIGGNNSGTGRTDIEYCRINPSGSVGDGTSGADQCTATTSFSNARFGHSSVVYDGFIYMIGGINTGGGTPRNDAERVLIDDSSSNNAIGTVTESVTVGGFITPRQNHTSEIYNGYIYIIGGLAADCDPIAGGNQPNCGDIQYCPIDIDGTVGTCVQQFGILSTARSEHASVVYNGYLYISGGWDGGSNLNDIVRCPLNSDGSVGTCISQASGATGFSNARARHSMEAYRDHLYIIAGYNSDEQEDIWYCDISPGDGSVSNCQRQTGMVGERGDHTSEIYNGMLYVIGGERVQDAFPWSTVNYNDVNRCPVNPNGSIAGCTTQSSVFTTDRNDHTTVMANGVLHVVGGWGGTAQSDVVHCSINANGSIASCPQNPNQQVNILKNNGGTTTGRRQASNIYYRGNIYVIGGLSTSDCDVTTGGTQTQCGDIQRVTIQDAPAHAAHYERVIDLGGARDTVDTMSFDAEAECNPQLSYELAGADGVFGAPSKVLPDPSPNTTIDLGGAAGVRYVKVVFNLNDELCGGVTELNSITVDYSVLPPDPPTLIAPADNATGLGLNPIFQLRTTDAYDTYVRYEILLFEDDCSTLIQTIDQSISQTGWSGQDAEASTAYVASNVLANSTIASYTYQYSDLDFATTYCWRASAIDPGGSNSPSAYSSDQLFTTNYPPSIPILTSPVSGQGGVSVNPEFRLYSVDQDGDYLRYRIEIYLADCVTPVDTIDQTISQAGWVSQSEQAGTAYASSQTAVHQYQSSTLAVSTTYCWRAQVIDPGGTNIWTNLSASPRLFNTSATSNDINVKIRGNTIIRGGTVIGQ